MIDLNVIVAVTGLWSPVQSGAAVPVTGSMQPPTIRPVAWPRVTSSFEIRNSKAVIPSASGSA